MARINVRVTVTAPEEINIPSVRANYSSTANIFRVFFEIFLSLSLLHSARVRVKPSILHRRPNVAASIPRQDQVVTQICVDSSNL
jgi:hypothetical protein